MLPFFILSLSGYVNAKQVAAMVELVDTRDLKSLGQ